MATIYDNEWAKLHNMARITKTRITKIWPKFTKSKWIILYKDATIEKNEGSNLYVVTIYENDETN